MSQQSVQDAFTAFLARFAKLSSEEQTAAAHSVIAFLAQQAPEGKKETTSSSSTSSSSSSTSQSTTSSVTGHKPSSHVAQQPGGNSSLNLFGGDGKDNKEKDKSAFYAAGNKQNQSSIFDSASNQSGTSVRVSSAPGGNSSISFGGDSKTSDTKTTTTSSASVSGDFHKDLKAAILEKNPSFQAFFKQCTQSGRTLTAAQLATGLDGLLKDKSKALGVNEQTILALFRKNFNKDEIGQSDFTKLFAQ